MGTMAPANGDIWGPEGAGPAQRIRAAEKSEVGAAFVAATLMLIQGRRVWTCDLLRWAAAGAFCVCSTTTACRRSLLRDAGLPQAS